MSKVWFITGTSTGFGRDLAIAALDAGHRVAATARKPEVLADLTEKYGDKVLTLRLDVTQPQEAEQAIQATLAKFGRLDVLVNNAGYGVFGALEEISDRQFRDQYETNVFGVLNVLRAALPTLRQQQAGYILNVSSIVGLTSPPAMSAYASSKFALEGISEALAAEVKPLGIHVVIVEPGAFRTAFGNSGVPKGERTLPEYAQTAGGTVAWLEGSIGVQPGDPKKAALAMLALADNPNPPLRLLLGSDALQMVRQKLDSLHADIAAGEPITTSMSYPDAA